VVVEKPSHLTFNHWRRMKARGIFTEYRRRDIFRVYVRSIAMYQLTHPHIPHNLNIQKHAVWIQNPFRFYNDFYIVYCIAGNGFRHYSFLGLDTA